MKAVIDKDKLPLTSLPTTPQAASVGGGAQQPDPTLASLISQQILTM